MLGGRSGRAAYAAVPRPVARPVGSDPHPVGRVSGRARSVKLGRGGAWRAAASRQTVRQQRYCCLPDRRFTSPHELARHGTAGVEQRGGGQAQQISSFLTKQSTKSEALPSTNVVSSESWRNFVSFPAKSYTTRSRSFTNHVTRLVTAWKQQCKKRDCRWDSNPPGCESSGRPSQAPATV